MDVATGSPGTIVSTVGSRTWAVRDYLKVEFDPYRMVLFALMFITIGRAHQHFSFLAPFRPALVLVFLAGIYAYLNPKYLAIGKVLATFPARVIAALGVMACLSVPMSISMGASAMFIISEYSKVLLFAFLLILGIRHTRDLYTLMWGFLLGTGFLGYLGTFVFKLRATRGDDFARIQSGYTFDSNDMGLVCVVGLVFAVLMVQVARPKARLAAFVVLAALGITIAKTGSRGTFVGLVGVGIALLFLLQSVPVVKRLMFVIVTGIVLLFAAPQGYWDQMATLLNPSQDYNMTAEGGRKKVLIRGLGYMMRNPITGLGISNFGRAEGMISARAEAREWDPTLPGVKWSAAHNSYLQAAAEMGIPGIVLFCMLVFGSMFGLFRLRRRLPRSWLHGDAEERFLYQAATHLPIAFIGFAISGTFVSFAYLDLVYILAAFTAGLYVSVEGKLRRGSGPIPAPAPAAAARRTYRGGLPPASGPAPVFRPPASRIVRS